MHIKYIQKDYTNLAVCQLVITSPILKLFNKNGEFKHLMSIKLIFTSWIALHFSDSLNKLHEPVAILIYLS